MPKKPKPGDVLEIAIDGNSAYLHYLGEHPKYGDVIRIFGIGPLPTSPLGMEALLSKGCISFYPAKAAVAQGLASIVAHHGSNLQVPMRLRRAGARAKNGTVLTWIIEEDGEEVVVRALSDDDLTLPIATIWNHEILCTRIRDNWRPEKEGGVVPWRAGDPIEKRYR